MTRIVVVGSSNTDMVVKTPRLPVPGETVLGSRFVMAFGGKGANQAVAAARLGAEVAFVSRVGSDSFGDGALEAMSAEGIDTSQVSRDPSEASGVALIFVDSSGENVIVVAPGANASLRPEHVDQARTIIERCDILLAQLEVPLETVSSAVRLAKQAGKKVILNPAPARPLPAALLGLVDVLTPNETEGAMLAGLDSGAEPSVICEKLREAGVRSVVLTLGSRGAMISTADGSALVPAPSVTAVDTTAAGDAFSGALAVALGEGKTIEEAARFAVRAASISITRLGAQPSLARRFEVDNA